MAGQNKRKEGFSDYVLRERCDRSDALTMAIAEFTRLAEKTQIPNISRESTS